MALEILLQKKPTPKAGRGALNTKMDSGEVLPSAEARKHTLSDAIDRYLKVTLPRAARNKNAAGQTRLLEWWRTQLGTRTLSSISSATIADVRDKLAAKESTRRSDGRRNNQPALSCVVWS